MSEIDNAVALKIKAPESAGALDTLGKIASLRRAAFNQGPQAFPDRVVPVASQPIAAAPIVPTRVATVPVPSNDPTYAVSPRQVVDSGPALTPAQTVISRFDW